MAAVNGKRKRGDTDSRPLTTKKVAIAASPVANKKSKARPRESIPQHTSKEFSNGTESSPSDQDVAVQVITGSYERVLHGILATIPARSLQPESIPHDSDLSQVDESNTGDIAYSDTFLFTAHSSSIRCLALSPPTESDKRILATGSSDERINLYNISTNRQDTRVTSTGPSLTSLSSTSTTAENPRNRSLGNLIHHDRAITCLQFPTKSKLFSSAEDNTIAISRTRDWTILSSIKAPIPKPQGRPSGDTAGPGEVPAGVNDYAIHPSQKLMLSVSRGEKCMRLWNLMTGKKAGVLNFERDLLAQVGESKYSSGEGRRVLWNEAGECFVVGFERGAAVFGIDSKPKAVIKASPPTKFYQMRFLPGAPDAELDILAASTEDGRILFFAIQNGDTEDESVQNLPTCSCIAQLGGRSAGISGRIKDFEILAPRKDETGAMLFVTGSSDGAIRLWTVFASMLKEVSGGNVETAAEAKGTTNKPVPQVGKLVGIVETGKRITCLGAFVMDGKAAGDFEEVAENGIPGAEEEESEIEDSE